MTDPTKAANEAFEASTEAIIAGQEHAAAQEEARAKDSAALMAKVEAKLKETNEQNKQDMKTVIIDVLENVFGKEQSTYVVKNRVPLLCQDVRGMKGDISEIKTMMKEDRENSEKQHEKFVTKSGEYLVIKAIVFIGSGTVLLYVLNSVLAK